MNIIECTDVHAVDESWEITKVCTNCGSTFTIQLKDIYWQQPYGSWTQYYYKCPCCEKLMDTSFTEDSKVRHTYVTLYWKTNQFKAPEEEQSPIVEYEDEKGLFSRFMNWFAG